MDLSSTGREVDDHMMQSVCAASEGALQQTVAAAACRTFVLPAEPVHHVTGVSSVTATQAEVRRATDRHVTDGALEGQALTDGALHPTSLTAAVAAVHPELCRENRDDRLLSERRWQLAGDGERAGPVTYQCLCEVQGGRKQT